MEPKFILNVSKELSNKNIFHKIERDLIKTRRSQIKIPEPNQDIAYLLGVIAGDGSLSQVKRNRGGYHYSFRIYAGTEDFLICLNNLLYKLFSIKGRIIKDKRKQSLYCLSIRNAALFFYFVNLGSEIGKKKADKIPKFVMSDKKLILHYLAGLVDTDGSIDKNRIQLKQKSEILLKKLNKILRVLELNPNEPKVNYTNNKPFYYIRFDNNLPLRLK